MKTFPEFNVPYDPKKRRGVKVFTFKNKNARKGKYSSKHDRKWEFEVKPDEIARERDLLFGMYSPHKVGVVTAENWRERIRDATTEKEIEDYKNLVKSRWKVDDFVRNCQGLIDLTCQNMQDLKVSVGMHSNYYHSAEKFHQGFFKGAVKALEGKIQNQPGYWGSWDAKVALFQEAGMKYSHLITYEVLKDELEKVYDKAKEEVEKKGFYNLWNWKGYSLFSSKEKPNPTPTPPSPVPNPQPNPNPGSDAPSYSDSDKEEITSLSETESNQKLEEIKNKLTDFAQKPIDLQVVPNEEKQKKVAELEDQLNKLEEHGNGVSNKIIAELKEQIRELRKQVEEIKKSLKSMLKEAKDYAQKLFSYFQKENVKQITFEEDGSAKVEYEDNKDSKTFSASEINNHKELGVLKEQVQQSEQKTLSRQELSQIVGAASSPTSTEQKHWEKYKYYYFVGIGAVLLVMGGLIVYWWMKKESTN